MHTACIRRCRTRPTQARECAKAHSLIYGEGERCKNICKKRESSACPVSDFVLMILVIGKETDMTAREISKIRI